jgi:hypothetical protein
LTLNQNAGRLTEILLYRYVVDAGNDRTSLLAASDGSSRTGSDWMSTGGRMSQT